MRMERTCRKGFLATRGGILVSTLFAYTGALRAYLTLAVELHIASGYTNRHIG